MKFEPIRGSLVVLMIVLLAVEANGCPCEEASDTNDIVGECKRDLECLRDHRSECREASHLLTKAFLDKANCEIIKLCSIEVILPYLLPFLLQGGDKQLEKKLKSTMEEKFSCMEDQEEMNNECTNEVAAKRCFRRVFKKYECVDAVLDECKIKGLKKMSEEMKHDFQ